MQDFIANMLNLFKPFLGVVRVSNAVTVRDAPLLLQACLAVVIRMSVNRRLCN